MNMLNKQIRDELAEWEGINYNQRIRERKERKEQQDEEKHWIFIAGSLVAKYLKDDLDITVYKGKGSAEKNAASFAPLENILTYLAAHKSFTDYIKTGKHEPPFDGF